ncbi:MAG: BglII/BstYI family type II restriction endonuclease [Tepidisphaeraceae bacterium]
MTTNELSPLEKQVHKTFEYSHFGGAEILQVQFPQFNYEIDDVISSIGTVQHDDAGSDKTKAGRRQSSPTKLNRQIRESLIARGYAEVAAMEMEIAQGESREGESSFRYASFAKQSVVVGVQTGMQPFSFYDLFRFQHLYDDFIADVGVEIVPTHHMHNQMSSGTSFGEQLLWDIGRLRRHFPAVPVKIILIDVEPPPDGHVVLVEGPQKTD